MKKTTLRATSIGVIVLSALIAVLLFFIGPDKGRLNVTGHHPGKSAAAFYNGSIIKLIVPNSPGGGYDKYARLMAPYLEKYTGAKVQIRNIPGAGGMRGVSELFRSPADGLTIALINGGSLAINRVAGIKDTAYEIRDLSFIGRVVTGTRVLALSRQSRYSTFSDILNSSGDVKIGATGLGGSTYVDAVLINEAFGHKMNVIHGFNNTAATQQAMLSGKIDCGWSSWGSALGLVASGQIKVILQSGRTRSAFLPDVPTVFEFVEKAPDPLQSENILKTWEALNEIGRVVVAPPDTQTQKRDFLREALRQTLHDPLFLADAAQTEREIGFASGEVLGDIVRRASHAATEMEQVISRAVQSSLQ